MPECFISCLTPSYQVIVRCRVSLVTWLCCNTMLYLVIVFTFHMFKLLQGLLRLVCEFRVVCCCMSRSTYDSVSGDAYEMPSAHLAIGQLCAARYSGTGEWHRCYIVDPLQKKVQVAFCVTTDNYPYMGGSG